jgi:hypothetical protein
LGGGGGEKRPSSKIIGPFFGFRRNCTIFVEKYGIDDFIRILRQSRAGLNGATWRYGRHGVAAWGGVKFHRHLYPHVESIAIPKLMYKNIDPAQDIADRQNLNIEVVDNRLSEAFCRRMYPRAIRPAGERVKSAT